MPIDLLLNVPAADLALGFEQEPSALFEVLAEIGGFAEEPESYDSFVEDFLADFVPAPLADPIAIDKAVRVAGLLRRMLEEITNSVSSASEGGAA